MTDAQSNPRHKIEAIKELRATAAIGGSADRPAETEHVRHSNRPHRRRWRRRTEKTINIDATNGDGPDNVIPLEGKPDVDAMVTTDRVSLRGISMTRKKNGSKFEKIRIGKDTEKLRDWLVNHWAKPTISARDICHLWTQLHPRRENGHEPGEDSGRTGMARPPQRRRRDMREWQIVPKTSKPLFLKLAHQQQQP